MGENKVNKVSVVPTGLPVMLDRKVHAEIPVKMEIVAERETPENSEKSGSMEKMATKGLTALEVRLDRRALKHLAAVKVHKEIAVSLASPAVPVMTVNRVDLVLRDVPVMSECACECQSNGSSDDSWSSQWDDDDSRIDQID